jgi:inositol oxygenase
MIKFTIFLAFYLFFANLYAAEQLRDYTNAPLHIKDFYKMQHVRQTYDFAKGQLEEIKAIMLQLNNANNSEESLNQLEKQNKIRRLSIWDTLIELDKLIDESDPDFNLPNSCHAFQTAESIRSSLARIAAEMNVNIEELDWLVLVGLLHDIGKIDALLRNVPQWAVVGDTFVVGCKFSEKNIFADYFVFNPDYENILYNNELGLYKKNIGLENLVMSFGHDEYGYQVLSKQSLLPKEALAVIRFHSFYPLHKENAYSDLLNDTIDLSHLEWIKTFSKFDLYSKTDIMPSKIELEQYYKNLINKYFPPKVGEKESLINWPVLRSIEK